LSRRLIDFPQALPGRNGILPAPALHCGDQLSLHIGPPADPADRLLELNPCAS
jgi:hypothetical protein